MDFQGFDWDDGNWPKCGQHGVSKDEIEYALEETRFRIRDPNPTEQRYRTAWPGGPSGRYVFVVFTYRENDSGVALIRPISARYMHEEEVEIYEHHFKST